MSALLPSNTRRIAVLGGNNAGKTVFITSLLDNLKNHDPARFDLDGWEIVEAIDEDISDIGLAEFKYETFRAQLTSEGEDEPKWPEKTCGASVRKLHLRLSKDGKRCTRLLELLDLPGERVADMYMFGRTYREWSKYVSDRMMAKIPTLADGWREEVDKMMRDIPFGPGGLGVDFRNKIFSLYKKVIVGFYSAYASVNITPSVLRLTIDGKPIGGSPDEYAAKISKLPIGLSDAQFVPLPDNFFKDPAALGLVKSFEEAYNTYRDSIVAPIATWLEHSDEAVYLIDVLNILQGGVDVFNSEFHLGETSLELFRNSSGDGFIGRIFAKLRDWLFCTHVSRVCLVATKADLASSVDRANMKTLAWEMLGKKIKSLNLDGYDKCICASVQSTVDIDIPGVGCAIKGDFGRGAQPFKPTAVPTTWPSSSAWDVSAFEFHETRPPFDKAHNRPPNQFGVDFVAKHILDILPR